MSTLERKRKGGSKELVNNPKLHKSPSLHLFTMCLFKNLNHQSLNAGGCWWGSPPSTVMRVWGLTKSKISVRDSISIRIWTISIFVHSSFMQIRINHSMDLRIIRLIRSFTPSLIRYVHSTPFVYSWAMLFHSSKPLIWSYKWSRRIEERWTVNLRRDMEGSKEHRD